MKSKVKKGKFQVWFPQINRRRIEVTAIGEGEARVKAYKKFIALCKAEAYVEEIEGIYEG